MKKQTETEAPTITPAQSPVISKPVQVCDEKGLPPVNQSKPMPAVKPPKKKD